MYLIYRFVISALVLSLLAWLIPGVTISGFLPAIAVAVILALINVSIKPVLEFIITPLTILTLGIAHLILNTLILMFIGTIVEGFHIDSFGWGILFSILVSIFGVSIGKSDLFK
jgi:putative membrane protein